MKIEIKKVKYARNKTFINFYNGSKIALRPFIYIKEGDLLEFLPSIENYEKIYKVFKDKASDKLKKIKIFPPYKKEEKVIMPPHCFKVIFRERKSPKDWEEIKDLERFHYRGKGLNKLVGRRTVLLAEIDGYGILGFGVISSTLAAAKPRFELLETNFKKQMNSKLINRIVRIPRIVIHPEFRGMNLGVLMAVHLVKYAKEYWDINHYAPIMVEVIAAMTEYHKFFEKAGFIKIGYTLGYKNGILPVYGSGSFDSRANIASYDFMQNQKPKPYLVYPLDSEIKKKIGKKEKNSMRYALEFLPKFSKLKNPIQFEHVSVSYKTKNTITKRTKIIKEVFGLDSENAPSTVFRNISFSIEPGDIVLITGASGSGKSTLIRLFTTRKSILKRDLWINGKISGINLKSIGILNKKYDNSLPLIEQLKQKGDIKDAIEILNSVGLSEAHLYTKRPDQISDGQRYRFAVSKICDSGKPIWVADEFVSSLNSEMAAIVSKGLRKLAVEFGATLILAAPHIQGFIGSLLPNKLIKLRWGANPRFYGLKINQLIPEGNLFHISISNTGSFPLTNVKIGITTIYGSFKSEVFFDCVNPKQKIRAKIRIKNRKEISALVVKSAQGVGDMICRK